jgi:acyl carrier protein
VNLGVSSRQAVMLSGDLEDWLGRELDPSLLWDRPNIAELSAWLAGG